MSVPATQTQSVDALLASRIKDAVARQQAGLALMEQGRQQWIDATMDLAVSLAEARARFPANQDFKDWLEAEGVTVPKNDRAALIALGQEPERAKVVLEKSEKTSVRRIVETEFRLPSPVNTNSVRAAPSSHSPEPSSHSHNPAARSSDINKTQPVPQIVEALLNDLRWCLHSAYAANNEANAIYTTYEDGSEELADEQWSLAASYKDRALGILVSLAGLEHDGKADPAYKHDMLLNLIAEADTRRVDARPNSKHISDIFKEVEA